MNNSTHADWTSIVGHFWALQLDADEPLRREVACALRVPWLNDRLA